MPTSALALGTVEPGVVRVGWHTEDGDHLDGDGIYDLWTGQPWELDSRLEPVSSHELPDGVPPDHVEVEDYSGWSAGPAVARIAVDLLHLDPARRWIWSDGDSWSVLGDGCVHAEIDPFLADGAPWTLEIDGASVGWRTVE